MCSVVLEFATPRVVELAEHSGGAKWGGHRCSDQPGSQALFELEMTSNRKDQGNVKSRGYYR